MRIVIELKRGEQPEVDPQQPLQAHPAPDDLRHHHAGDRRRPPARAAAARHPRALHRVPPRGRPAANRVRAAEGRGARPHPRRAADRARQPRPRDHAHPGIEEPGRSARRPDDAVRALAAPVAGDPRHAAAAPHRTRAPEDPRRARRPDEDHRAAARHPVERRAADGHHHEGADRGPRQVLATSGARRSSRRAASSASRT